MIIDYYIDLYHGPQILNASGETESFIFGHENVPLFTLIWMRKFMGHNDSGCLWKWIKIVNDFSLRIALSFIYVCSRVLVPIWMLTFAWEPTEEMLDQPPDLTEEQKNKYYFYNSHYPWNYQYIALFGCLSVGVICSLAVIKDIQKCVWWLLAFIISFDKNCCWKFCHIFTAIIDLGIVAICSYAFFLWIWIASYVVIYSIHTLCW